MVYARNFLVTCAVSFLFVAAPGSGYGQRPVGNLKVVISGLRTDDGLVNVGLYDTKESYLSRGTIEPFRKAKVAVKDRQAQHTFEGVPFGEYTIKFFHDENGNGKIDFSFLRIPAEPYGFSRNARGILGLPRYDRAKFTIDTADMTMRLKI